MKTKYMMDDEIIHILKVEGYEEVSGVNGFDWLASGSYDEFSIKSNSKKEYEEYTCYDPETDMEFKSWVDMALYLYGYKYCLKSIRSDVCDYIDTYFLNE